MFCSLKTIVWLFNASDSIHLKRETKEEKSKCKITQPGKSALPAMLDGQVFAVDAVAALHEGVGGLVVD